jgi:hypothetical protein
MSYIIHSETKIGNFLLPFVCHGMMKFKNKKEKKSIIDCEIRGESFENLIFSHQHRLAVSKGVAKTIMAAKEFSFWDAKKENTLDT